MYLLPHFHFNSPLQAPFKSGEVDRYTNTTESDQTFL